MVQGPDSIKAPLVQPNDAAPAPKPKFRPEQRPEFKAEPDVVELSPKAQETRQLAPKVASLPEVVQSRVEEVRSRLNQIANSPSNNAKVAEKLLTEN